jgi:transcriptional regulator with XRE-family HTH domain
MRAHLDDPGDLGFLIRRIREQHELSQRQLAARLGVSQRYLYELEAGRPKRIDHHYFSVLAALGIKLIAEFDDARAR